MSKKRSRQVSPRRPSGFRRRESNPQFVTTEGDGVVFVVARYQHDDLGKIRRVLEPLDEFGLDAELEAKPDGSLRFSWYETQPDPRSSAPFVDGPRILATLTLTPTTFEVEAMSRQRLNKCRQRLGELLGDHIRLERIETKSVNRAMREAASRPHDTEPPFIPPPELVAEMEEKMLRRWIDESIPALGGLTPREAVKTPEGRQQVLDLLDYIGRQQSQMKKTPGMFSPDYRKVKKMLDLE